MFNPCHGEKPWRPENLRGGMIRTGIKRAEPVVEKYRTVQNIGVSNDYDHTGRHCRTYD